MHYVKRMYFDELHRYFSYLNNEERKLVVRNAALHFTTHSIQRRNFYQEDLNKHDN